MVAGLGADSIGGEEVGDVRERTVTGHENDDTLNTVLFFQHSASLRHVHDHY